MNFNTALVKLDEGPRLREILSGGGILNATDTLGWLMEAPFYGWTFSITERMFNILAIEKLITWKTEVQHKTIRRATHCHLKCYLRKKEMLLGSFNLSAPTIEDVSIVIRNKDQVALMNKQFKEHWKALA